MSKGTLSDIWFEELCAARDRVAERLGIDGDADPGIGGDPIRQLLSSTADRAAGALLEHAKPCWRCEEPTFNDDDECDECRETLRRGTLNERCESCEEPHFGRC